jgi:hypothetical protein
MSKSAFFNMIRSGLRQKSRWWKPIAECKKAARRPYKGPNKRMKWEFLCANCGLYHPDKNTVVDHIIPAGQLNSFEDLPEFCRKLFCEIEGLQCLCKACHQLKTNEERKQLKQNNE